MKISVGAAMALAILFVGMISLSCTSDGSSLATEEFVVTATFYHSTDNILSIAIPKAGGEVTDYAGSYDKKQSINYQSLVTIPGHSITNGAISYGGMRVTVSPPLDPVNPNDATVFFNTDLIFYELDEGLTGERVVSNKCRIVTPSFAINY